MKINFRYPGGKAKIRDKLFEYFPQEGRYYLELFGGRGNIFFEWVKRSSFHTYTVADIKTGVFFKALESTNLDTLPNTVTAVEYDYWKGRFLAGDPIAILLEPVVTFSGKGYSYGYCAGRYNKRKYTALCLEAQAILQRSNVASRTANWANYNLDVYDWNDFLYLDPPYLDATLGTGYSEIDHLALMKVLDEAEFMWAISGYDSELYRTWLGEPTFMVTRNREMTNTPNSTEVECLWTNY